MPDIPNDEAMLGTIWARYHRQLNDLDLSIGTEARCQLALDLGLLIGMCLKLKADSGKSGDDAFISAAARTDQPPQDSKKRTDTT